MAEKPPPSFAPVYCAMYPALVKIAKDHGYALCVHGSLQRDFDLVAVPWVDPGLVAEPEVLIESMRAALGGSLEPNAASWTRPGDHGNKPHGRRCWSIYLGRDYLDISVMPKVPPRPDPFKEEP